MAGSGNTISPSDRDRTFDGGLVVPGRPTSFPNVPRLPAVLLAAVLFWADVRTSASAQEPLRPPALQDEPRDVTDLDLDDLIRVRVTSASRKEQLLSDVPAAIT